MSNPAALNDTYCRSLLSLVPTTGTLNSSYPSQCRSCLQNGCTWCLRKTNPFCWSGRTADLSHTNDVRFSSCPSAAFTYSTSGITDIENKCGVSNDISAGEIAALIIWTIILLCCLGSCCFTVLYVVYHRGKRGQVHPDNSWGEGRSPYVGGGQYMGGQYMAGAVYLQPIETDHQSHSMPVQTGVVVLQHPQQMDPVLDATNLMDQSRSKPLPIAIARPLD